MLKMITELNPIQQYTSKNLSVISSIYQSKAFTKYAIYSLIAYIVMRNPKLGLLALNCNTASVIVFNYIRFFNPILYNGYKKMVKHEYNITETKFQAGDITFHIIPLSITIYSRRFWYNKLSCQTTISISMLSFLYELLWAYYYSNGINVCKAYNLPEEYNTLSNGQCKRLWFLIFICHNVTSIQKTTRYYLA